MPIHSLLQYTNLIKIMLTYLVCNCKTLLKVTPTFCQQLTFLLLVMLSLLHECIKLIVAYIGLYLFKIMKAKFGPMILRKCYIGKLFLFYFSYRNKRNRCHTKQRNVELFLKIHVISQCNNKNP